MGGYVSGRSGVRAGTLPVLIQRKPGEEAMKTNWEHQKKAIVTDQKYRTDDEKIHEMDMHRVKESEEPDPELIPKQADKAVTDEKE
jgi:hypothetical protein